jgi:hypothetical protein
MRRSITLPLVALVVLGGLAAHARAGSISGTVSGDTTLTPISPNVFLQSFSGEGDDTVLGSFTMQSQSTIDLSNPLDIIISNGTCSQTFADGTLTGTCSGTGTTTGMGTGTFETEIVFAGGTGLFAGATEEMTVTGTEISTGPMTEDHPSAQSPAATEALGREGRSIVTVVGQKPPSGSASRWAGPRRNPWRWPVRQA